MGEPREDGSGEGEAVGDRRPPAGAHDDVTAPTALGERSHTAGVASSDATDRDQGINSAIYLLQATQQHHVQISVMADVKASILITATSLILTAAVTFSQGNIRPGLLALMIGSFLALVGALLAVLPAPYEPAKAPRPGSPGFNLLFFGHFTQLSADEYVERILALTDNAEHVFATQARDIHELGTFLQHSKFRPLRFGYLAFLTGVAAAIIVEIGSTLLS